MKLISQGAEARIYQDGERILKQRIAKSYRLPGLDLQLRKQRTRSEAKLLQKAAGIAPKLLAVDEHTMTLTLEYLDGKLLKDVLSTFSSQERHNLLLQLGKHAQLHQQNIIHGDLTTSNILMHNNTPYLIDFGLGFISLNLKIRRLIYIFLNTLMSKHFSLSAAAFASVLEGYSFTWEHRAVIQRLEKVERREDKTEMIITIFKRHRFSVLIHSPVVQWSIFVLVKPAKTLDALWRHKRQFESARGYFLLYYS